MSLFVSMLIYLLAILFHCFYLFSFLTVLISNLSVSPSKSMYMSYLLFVVCLLLFFSRCLFIYFLSLFDPVGHDEMRNKARQEAEDHAL